MNLLDANTIDKDCKLKTKILIVGSGTGGSSTAKILSENDYEFTILEEGDYHENKKEKSKLSSNISKWRNSGMIPIISNGNIFSYGEGMCVGGGSEINGALMWRTPEKILNQWSKDFGLTNISYNEMENFFNIYEKDLSVSHQEQNENFNKASTILETASKNLNWKFEKVKRAQISCMNTNQCPVGCPTDAKQTMTKTLLKKVLKKNGNLIYNLKVEKIVIERGGAIKVLAKNLKKKRVEIFFEKIFLCAGPLHTPLILQNSGIKKNIGSNFYIQPNLKIAVMFKEEINAHLGTMMTRQITEFRTENFTIGSSNYSPAYLSLSASGAGKEGLDFLNNWKKVALYISLLKIESVGSIRKIPMINFPLINYNLSSRDVELVKHAMKKMGEAFFSLNIEKMLTPFSKFPVVNSLGELNKNLENKKLSSKFELNAVHGMSTCRMSIDPLKFKTATDNYGKLYGLKNIYVGDASLLPTSLGINPQETISAVVMRNTSNFCGN